MAELDKLGINLKRCTYKTLKCLKKSSIYGDAISVDYNSEKQKIHISNDAKKEFKTDRLESLFEQNNIKTVEFENLGRDVKKATCISSTCSIICSRLIMECLKKTPFLKVKNILYRKMGVNIKNVDAIIIAPNVLIDYIYPELVFIGSGTIIGEEAILTTHYFTPSKFVIGYISIGNDCLIRARSIVLPGMNIKDNSFVGVNTVITKYIDSNS